MNSKNPMCPFRWQKAFPHPLKKGRCLSILVLTMLCFSPAGRASEVDELASDQISVRELMRLETALALKRHRTDAGSRPSGATEPRHEALGELASTKLLAIYGVGRKLMAEVQVGGQTLLFVRGRPEAVGPGRKHAMRLVDISGRCVELTMQGRRQSLCASLPGAGKG